MLDGVQARLHRPLPDVRPHYVRHGSAVEQTTKAACLWGAPPPSSASSFLSHFSLHPSAKRQKGGARNGGSASQGPPAVTIGDPRAQERQALSSPANPRPASFLAADRTGRSIKLESLRREAKLSGGEFQTSMYPCLPSCRCSAILPFNSTCTCHVRVYMETCRFLSAPKSSISSLAGWPAFRGQAISPEHRKMSRKFILTTAVTEQQPHPSLSVLFLIWDWVRSFQHS